MKLLKREKLNETHLNMYYTDNARKEVLRQLREPLLKAWDIYKGNVSIGILPRDAEFDNAVNWYYQILNLDEYSIKNVPSCIQKYVR